MTIKPPPQVRGCPECGAPLPIKAAKCWLCQSDLTHSSTAGAPGKGSLGNSDVAGEVIMAEDAGPPRFAANEIGFAVATFLIVGLMVLMGIGCFAIAPGLGIAYLLFAVPPLVITIARAQNRESRDGRSTWANRFVTLLISTSVAVLVALLVAVAAFVAFFIWCWTQILSGPGGFH